MEEHRITAEEVIARIESKHVKAALNITPEEIVNADHRLVERKRMSALRRKLSERLVRAKNQTAMLTTFNEVDMSALIALRKKWQTDFMQKTGVKLGYMSFFTKAATLALQRYPEVNAQIDGDEIIYSTFNDIGIAVQTPKGLMVPVVRDTRGKSIAQLEVEIAKLAEKSRNGTISIDDLQGGTFTITNGGVFGSLFSTPIINHPQTAILGMHTIQERPVAINGQVVIRPMMYLALSYDHRLIDGKESVGFLLTIKTLIENPMMMLYDSPDPEQTLLGI